MVQVIQSNRQRTPTAAQQLAGGFLHGGMSALQQYQQMQQQRQQMQQENQAARKLGIDLEGINDPKMRQQALASALQGQNQLNVENLRQFGKQGRLEQTQDYLSKIFGGQGQPGQMGQMGQNEPQQGASPEMRRGFDPSQLTDEQIAVASSLDPNLGRTLAHQKDVGLREKRAEEDIKRRNKEIERKEELDFHKESQKYDEELNEHYKRSLNQQEAIQNIEKAIASGNVKPGHASSWLKGFGAIGNKIANAILNEDEATILGSIPYLIEGWKEVFGVRLSDADLRVIQDKLPDIGKSQEANRSIMNIMKKYSDYSKLRYEIGREIKKNNKNLRPIGYTDLIEDKFKDMIQPIMIRNPNTGNVVPIPAYKASDYIKAGGEVVNE